MMRRWEGMSEEGANFINRNVSQKFASLRNGTENEEDEKWKNN